MTIGIAFSIKSNLGVSPVSTIPYTLTVVWHVEIGLATIIFHCFLVILQIILLRKSFEIKKSYTSNCGNYIWILHKFFSISNVIHTQLKYSTNITNLSNNQYYSNSIWNLSLFTTKYNTTSRRRCNASNSYCNKKTILKNKSIF